MLADRHAAPWWIAGPLLKSSDAFEVFADLLRAIRRGPSTAFPRRLFIPILFREGSEVFDLGAACVVCHSVACWPR
jgi:hypothetical protein